MATQLLYSASGAFDDLNAVLVHNDTVLERYQQIGQRLAARWLAEQMNYGDYMYRSSRLRDRMSRHLISKLPAKRR